MRETIIRDLTPEEKKDRVELGKGTTFTKEFRKLLVKNQQEHVKKRIPFCARCAMMDFEENVRLYLQDKNKRDETINISNSKLLQKCLPKFKDYGDINRFKLLSTAEDRGSKVVDGIHTSIIRGYNLNYVCKICGGDKVGGVTVYLDKYEYDLRENTKKKGGK